MTEERKSVEPTPVDIEAALVGLRAGDTIFAKWLRLAKIDDAVSNVEEFRLGDLMWWAETVDPHGLYGEWIGGGDTPTEAAAGAWIVASLGAFPPIIPAWRRQRPLESVIGHDFPASVLTETEYLRVPRRVSPGWTFELIGSPAGRRN